MITNAVAGRAMTQHIDDESFDQISRALGCYDKIYKLVLDLCKIAGKNPALEGLAERLFDLVLDQEQELFGIIEEMKSGQSVAKPK